MDNYSPDCQLTFCDERNQALLKTRLINVSLRPSDEGLRECRLTLTMSPATYNHIATHALFNLNPEFRGPLSNGDFQPEGDFQLEITLQPDLLAQLFAQATTPETVASYLTTLSQPPPPDFSTSPTEPNAPPSPHPLLVPENWFCLSVQQSHAAGTTGYKTFWNYVNPATFSQSTTSSDTVADGIVNFVKDWTQAKLTEATQEATAGLFQGIGNLFGELETWIDRSLPEDSFEDEQDETDSAMLDVVIEFFEADDWPFARLNDPELLQVAFQGDNGRWNCYAQVREAAQEFVFYSLCPIIVPEEKRSQLAEFITRANYGLMIGNFEMDVTDGEIRYKTSIDVEGDRLSESLVRRLVYANVTMMDVYLPGIVDVVETGVTPDVAISQIEGN